MSLSTRYGFADAPTSAILGGSSVGWTTAAGTLAAAGTSLSVISSSAFPIGLEFDVLIGLRDEQTNLWSNAEIRHVTVVSGTTWTVAAGSLDHASGESIALTVTAAGLKNNPGALTDTGDMPYLNASGRMDRLAAPANGNYALNFASAIPSYVSAPTWTTLASPPNGTVLGASGTPYASIQLGNLASVFDSARRVLRIHTTDSALAGLARNLIWSDSYYNPSSSSDNGYLLFMNADVTFSGTHDSTGYLALAAWNAFHSGTGTLASLRGNQVGVNVDGGGTLGTGVSFSAESYVAAGSAVSGEVRAFDIFGTWFDGPVGSFIGFHAATPHVTDTLGSYYTFKIDDHSAITPSGDNYVFYYGTAGKFTVASTGAVTSLSSVTATNFAGGTWQGKTFTLGGNLVLTGAFNATFAIPSSSTWTFPSGGGNLITFPDLASPPNGTALGSLALPFGDVYANDGDFRATDAIFSVYQDFVNFNYGFSIYPADSSSGLIAFTYSQAPDTADANATAASIFAATSESTTNNALFITGLQSGAASYLGTGRTTIRTVGGSLYTYNSGLGTINEAMGALIGIGSVSPDGDIGNAFGTYVLFSQTTTTPNTNHAYGHYVNNTSTSAPTIDFVSFYTKTVAGAATDAYAFWSDEQGVFRIKADNTFNSVYQAIPALYNPQFTKYTPGAANFERIVYQWESNVGTLTTEKGGTGTLRALNLGDAGVQVQVNGKNLTLSGNLTTTGAFNATFAIPSSSTWTFPSGGGTLLTTSGAGSSLTFPGTLSIASGKTLTASNTITIVATDDITMTTPTTSFTVARTDAANSFTGAQTITFGTSSAVALGINLTANSSGRRAYAFAGDGNTEFFLQRWTNGFGAAASNLIKWNNSIVTDTTIVGTLQIEQTLYVGAIADVPLVRGGAAATLQMGVDVNGAATNQIFQAANGTTGSDRTGGNLTVRSGSGTGAGAVSSLLFQTPAVGSTGTTTQTQTTRLTLTEGLATFATPVVITEVVGSSGLTITGATQTSSFPVLSLTQTWNNGSTTFTGIKGVFTTTASAAASLLLDLHAGSSPATKFSVSSAGKVVIGGALDAAGTWQFGGAATGVLRFVNSAGPNISIDIVGDNSGSGGPAEIRFSSLGFIAWNSTSTISTGSRDTFLGRGGAAATLQIGADVNGAAVNQVFQAANGITGTDRTGGNLTLASGKGTGAGAVSSLIFQTPDVLTTGTTAQSLSTKLTLGSPNAVTITEQVGGSGLTITGAIQTSSFPPLKITQTWNNGSTVFDAITVAITNSASSSSSTIFKATTGGTVFFQVARGGAMSVSNQIDLIASAGGTTLVQSSIRADGFYTTSDGVLKWSNVASGSSNIFSGSFDLFIKRAAAATLQMGVDVDGAAVNQIFQAANGVTGSDRTGGNLTLRPGAGTGAGAVSSYVIQTPSIGTSGTTAQTQTTRWTVTEGSTTWAEATNLAFGTSTGSKIGTSTSQKFAFWNVTPVVQQVLATGAAHTVDDVITFLQTVGLCKQS